MGMDRKSGAKMARGKVKKSSSSSSSGRRRRGNEAVSRRNTFDVAPSRYDSSSLQSSASDIGAAAGRRQLTATTYDAIDREVQAMSPPPFETFGSIASRSRNDGNRRYVEEVDSSVAAVSSLNAPPASGSGKYLKRNSFTSRVMSLFLSSSPSTSPLPPPSTASYSSSSPSPHPKKSSPLLDKTSPSDHLDVTSSDTPVEVLAALASINRGGNRGGSRVDGTEMNGRGRRRRRRRSL